MSVKKILIVSLLCTLFIGCNSSKSPVINSEPEPEQQIPDPIIPETINCSSLKKLDFTDAFAEQAVENYSAANVIDGSFFHASRWSTDNNQSSLTLTLDEVSLVKGLSITWLNLDQRSYAFDIETSQDNINWLPVLTSGISDLSTRRSEFYEVIESSARYIKIIPNGSNVNDGNHIIEVEAFGCTNNVVSTIKLNDWYLSIPVDEIENSKAKSIYESTLNNQYFNAEFFFLKNDGGMVFRAPIEGAKTSANTKYTRTELREMLRSGNTNISTQGVNKNNWVFSSAPMSDQNAAGGVDGELSAELSVNHVTQTGDDSQVGRVIIGQIHANSDEPIRIYYRKLPNNDKGAIYFAHEIESGDDIYYELIGTRSNSAVNPTKGIKLNERFGYKIKVAGHSLSLTITREGYDDVSQTIDMSLSGYDKGGQYMYFKAGVYNQNNTGDPKDYVQATFYSLDNYHEGYINN